MVFSSINFLYLFLPCVLILYFLVPAKLKNLILLVFSLIFYFFGEQLLVLIMVLSSVVDYTCSHLIDKYRKDKYIPKIFLILSITINLGLLGYFKYSNFFIENFNALFGQNIDLLKVALPIGISFYTFQTMSYTIDVYLGNAKVQKNFLNFATFVTLFPQLVAGPIVRYTDIADELDSRKHSFSDFAYGVRRFILGLSKKIFIANTFAELADVFIYSNEKSVLFYWLYSIAFFFQIYFDFSGYSDMAIGLGRMFGFHFPENFNYPYISKSVTEFWRRWHISLGSWFRDYVYIPLGGNRVSKYRHIINIAVVWFLTGFWHGASWNFILWGVFYAVFLLGEKLLYGKALAKLPMFVQHIYTLLAVFFGFIIFNGSSMSEIGTNLKGMFSFGTLPLAGAESLYYLRSYAIMFIIAIIASTPLLTNLVNKARQNEKFKATFDILEVIVLAVMLMFATGFLVNGSFNPFLYFRF